MIDLFTTEKQFLNTDEVSAIFGVTKRTVYNWILERRVESVTIAGTIRISVRSLRAQVHDVEQTLRLPTISRYVRTHRGSPSLSA